MTAGRRDRRIQFERATVTEDDYGQDVQAWAVHGEEYAAVYYGRGDERRRAAVEQASQGATFQVLSNIVTRGITVRDRIAFDGAEWDIENISPDTPRRGLYEFTAVRSR